jgi:hypothetical protein
LKKQRSGELRAVVQADARLRSREFIRGTCAARATFGFEDAGPGAKRRLAATREFVE